WSIHLVGTKTIDGRGVYENNSIGKNNSAGAVIQEWWVRVRVVNNSNEPVNGSDVVVDDPNHNKIVWGTTGNDGWVIWNQSGYSSINLTDYTIANSGSLNDVTYYEFAAYLDTDNDGKPNAHESVFEKINENEVIYITLNV
ncbi:MAG: hypothetical protein DRN20_03195, partial [Thermoplasmata archaeon]